MDIVTNIGTIDYVQARKEFDGYALYFRGTRNEIFQGQRFATAALARSYWKAMDVKRQQPQPQPRS